MSCRDKCPTESFCILYLSRVVSSSGLAASWLYPLRTAAVVLTVVLTVCDSLRPCGGCERQPVEVLTSPSAGCIGRRGRLTSPRPSTNTRAGRLLGWRTRGVMRAAALQTANAADYI